MPLRREVETKFKLRNKNEIESAISRLFAFGGFEEHETCTQLDYTLDTPDWTCRRNGLILRFRRLMSDGAKPMVLLTFKEKRELAMFRDYDETEFDLNFPDMEAWRHIQTRLLKVTKLQLPGSILLPGKFTSIVDAVRKAGFSRHRILLEKIRREFSLSSDGIHVTIDSFPDGIGTYLEIEAYDPTNLEKYIQQLALSDYELEPLDYGEILKRHKRHLPEVLQRTAVFDTNVRDIIIGSLGQV
jgi:adenylate cyclase class IV